jgi:uncharacterized membrane protein
VSISETRSRPSTRRHWRTVGRWIFGLLFILAGVGHFVSPQTYLKIMPPYLPMHRELVLLSGVFEVALGGMLLIPRWSRLAAWGLIALLVAVFPANIFLYQHQELLPLPPIVHLLRLPMQGLLILWAYAYTTRDDEPSPSRSIKDSQCD